MDARPPIRELKRFTNDPGIRSKGIIVSTAAKESPESLLVRLDAAASAVEGYYAQHRDELETRDAIVLLAVEAGIPHAQIANRARVSCPRINQIIARRWPR
jgi:hypothetical protein